jgi:hypothetical protein
MVTVSMVKQRLNITEIQITMALYSGRLPKPSQFLNGEPAWDSEYIEPFVALWERLLIKRRGN